MGVLRCTVCGGELEVNADMSVGVCKYCDSTITIPKELDRKGNLYNRAVFLRQNNQFDKAMAVYEDILKEDNTDADAHWGLVLSKYGIEYVTDPVTKEHIPTCHRTQEESILTDYDYRAAVEYSHFEAGRVIEQAAKRISEIQQRILNISRNEPAYDVFICYKETDDNGNRTEDSVIAQDLYYELTKKGYKIFFAKKTLENKLGSEYEPIIYAALNSAKVMIVLGTKPEYFEAVWVKNEWSRFLRMGKQQDKTIIPSYRGISPCDLPAELSCFQAQDMSRIGFMQDLTDGIERCMRGSHAQNNIGENTPVNIGTGIALERLLKNGETYINLNNLEMAKKVYMTATEEYPEDYRGWWGLIVSSTNNLSTVNWDENKERDIMVWYSYAKKMAKSDEIIQIEEKYLEFLRKKANVKAEYEIKNVRYILQIYDQDIEEKKKEKSKIDLDIEKRKEAIDTIEKEIEEQNLESKNIIFDDKIKKKKILQGSSAFFVGILLLVILNLRFNIFVLLLFITFIVLGIMIIKNVFDKECEIDKINNIRIIKENVREKKLIDLKKREDIAETSQKDILKRQNKIDQCTTYLNYGIEIITGVIFSEICKTIGVEVKCSQEASELRKIILLEHFANFNIKM